MKTNAHLRDKPSIPIREHNGGYVAEGPGFYIWDEDPSEVLRVARELARGNYSVTPSTRLLVVRDDFELAPAS